MGNNRISEHFRDARRKPEPVTDWFTVDCDCGSVNVSREVAERILEVIRHDGPPRFLRVESILGAEVFIRTDTVTRIEESTPAVRRARRRQWKMLDDEDDNDEEERWS